jgi:hypothetical protein
VSISPSARRFKNVNINECDRDFIFIVGSGPYYHCPHCIAEFISPRVFNIHQADSTINEVSLSIDDNCLSSLFKSIERGESLSISHENRSTYLDLFCQLHNAERYEFVQEELSIETVFDLMKLKCPLESDSSVENEFDDPFSTLESLDFWKIETIVSSPELKLKSEDLLYTFICTGLENNPDFFGLFQHIQFDFLSTENMRKFCELVWKSFDRFNLSIFESLRTCLIIVVTPFKANSRGEVGIIRSLAKRYCGNVQAKGEMRIEMNRKDDRRWKSKHGDNAAKSRTLTTVKS